jgi:CDP-diacylglycerol---glycerol-3-phosphate 3-phosphatidyltransferase
MSQMNPAGESTAGRPSGMAAIKAGVRSRMEVVGRVIGATGISPNGLTLLGLVLNIGAGAIVASGMLLAGGIALLIASAFDMLDGAVARATGKASRFGAFLDSVIDRYCEAVVLIGLIVVLSRAGDTPLVVAATAALVGSLLVSYARARAEGLGLDCEVGLLQRPERVIILAIGLIAADYLLAPVIWTLAVVTNITVVQRILHVRGLLRVG